MGPISRWAVNKPKTAIAAWLGMAILIGILAANFAGSYNDSFSLPDTESSKAQALLTKMPGGSAAADASTSTVVWSNDTEPAKSKAVTEQATAMLTQISKNPSVSCVTNPYGKSIGTDCPAASAGSSGASAGSASASDAEAAAAAKALYDKLPEHAKKAMAGMGPQGISLDGKVAFATISYNVSPDKLSQADAKEILADVAAANGIDGTTVGINGQGLTVASMEPPSSEGIGIIVALVVLMFAFGSLVAAFLPILSAIVSLGVAQAVVLLVAHFFNVATFAPTLAAMIGLGVGIDYSLFVINRYKQALDGGKEPRDAALESVQTAGRAVLFAAFTVVIALLGLFVLRIDFFNGIAIAAALTVVLMMIGATLLLPAVLSLLGRKAFAIKMPWARKAKPHDPDRGAFASYGRWLEGNFKWFGALVLVILLVIAIPAMSLRQGFTDDGGQAEGSPQRTAYNLLSEGFSPGITGPFVIAVESEKAGDSVPATMLAANLLTQDGVAAAVPAPAAKDSKITAVQVISTSDPQSETTTALLKTIRNYSIPVAMAEAAEVGSVATAYVGGFQAVAQDFTQVLTNALPLFLLVVIGLGFLVLIVLFRSILVPLTGAVTSLLSLMASLGVVVAVFQWGWFNSLLGVSGTGPIAPFLPIMVFAILFGLSMDYQVFLVSRMDEEWEKTHDNRAAVLRGIASSGRVVALAALIMTSVFAAFILPVDPTIKLFGVALATAIVFDAFLVRLVIVPSVMLTLGKANWWAPKWLKRILPKVTVE